MRTSAESGGATRAPATRDQVDAYRFGLRRLEAALVRGDPVPLHEQLRSQRRAAIAGALVGMLALGGVAIWAQVAPRPDWTRQAVVVGSGSGAMYVVAHEPDRLVPVANLPAGRLVLAALRAGGASAADPATAVPVLVADADLDAAPRTPTAAVAGATAVRLGGAVIAPRWAVCDTADPESGRGALRTTVVGGAEPVAPSGGAVLLAVRGGDTWLVTGGRRHRVDLADRAVVSTMGLGGREPRPASAALLNALPEGPPLRTPRIPGAGAANGPGRVGDVLVGRPAGEGPPTHHVLLSGGAQQVGPAVAQTLRAAGSRTREVGPEELAGLPPVEELDVEGWPETVGPLREAGDAPVVCGVWSAADGGALLVGSALPVPAGAAGVDLVQADGAGERADAVVLSPAGGGAVRATAPGRADGAGPLWLVAASGVAYGVADEPTAQALGVTAAEPAPEWALRLLPVGGTLDLAAARETVDVLPG
ncbi:type VII secretion protein EccB [Pseudonocardia hydrocarbonoxydans]|uniref:Type VII secretion protein EccB n=1 Tax=Pseudonocardia hydrocarbonoxydans TaxID=76726 RepID=A0A4Y3WNI4_9PSEU|nr:type VII secretion protein EccB [Pseudonocardia hydrocarbonoxydans]GEC20365.1 type VII secretion protein EccB [Pseudonocardia hydrocarbonoxydans]